MYSPAADSNPILAAMHTNLTVRTGNASHRTVTPRLLDLVAIGVMIRCVDHPVSAIEAYQTCDRREKGWLKSELVVAET